MISRSFSALLNIFKEEYYNTYTSTRRGEIPLRRVTDSLIFFVNPAPDHWQLRCAAGHRNPGMAWELAAALCRRDILSLVSSLATLPYGLDSNVPQLLANMLTKPSVFYYLPIVPCNLVSIKLLLLLLYLNPAVHHNALPQGLYSIKPSTIILCIQCYPRGFIQMFLNYYPTC